MNFDGSCCGNCNKEIYQSQRFCDKCGNRLDHSIDEVKLPKGKIKRSSRYNVLTFFGCCGANNEPVIADTTIRENLNRDISLQSKHKADQDTWEPQDIDIVNVDGNEHISLSAIKEIHTDTNLQSEQHGFQKEGETESSIDFTCLSSKKDIQTDECFQSPSAIKEILTDEDLQSEHERLQEPGDIETSIEHGSTDKKDIQKDGCLQSEHDEHKDPQNSEFSLEHGLSSKKDIQTDECLQSPSAIKEILTDEDLQSEHERLQEPGDIETSIEHGPSESEDVQRNEILKIEHGHQQKPEDTESSVENDSYAIKEIQTDEHLQSEQERLQEPGHSGKNDKQTDRCLQTDHDVRHELQDIESSTEKGPSAEEDIQNGEILQIEHDHSKERGDTESTIAIGSSTKNDIQRDKCLESEHDGLHDYMGNIDSSTDIASEFEELYASYKQDGIVKTTLYARQKLNEVKTGIIKFAVVGRSGVGKSSFINLMLDLQKGGDNYAKTGTGDTTTKMTEYKHPKNENITFWDTPGFGTIEMTTKKFTSEFGPQIHTFDYFFIFLDTVIMEGDVWLANQIKGYGTPFCFVRCKIDIDVNIGNEIEIIRQKLKRSMDANDIVKGSSLFFISNELSYCHTGDFREMFAHISKHLPKAKAESLAFFLPFLTPEAIETKFESLQKRIKYVAFIAGVISGVPIPLLDIPVNMKLARDEIEQFHKVFLLDKDMVKNVPGVKHKTLSYTDIKQIFLGIGIGVTNVATIGAVIMSQADILLPGVGSVASGTSAFFYAHKFLNQILIEMKEDAYSVYKHYTNVK